MTMHRLEFTVWGKPVTQGSMNPGRNGKMFHKKTLKPWRSAVLDAALEAVTDPSLIPIPREIPVTVEVEFIFAKPAKPKYEFPARADVDKLFRAIGDAISVGEYSILTDDDQISEITAWKVYGEEDCANVSLTWVT